MGKSRDGTCVHLGLGSKGLDGSEQWLVRGSAAPGLGGRGEPCSGEKAGRPANVRVGKLKGGEGRARGVQPTRDWSRAPSSPREYPWRGGGRLGVARGRRPGTFTVGTRRWGRTFPYVPRQQSRGMGRLHGRRGDRVRRRREWRARHGRRGVATARATRGARRRGVHGGVAQGAGSTMHMDQWALAGLGMRAQQGRGANAARRRHRRVL
jgi:hypothetical protein